MADENVPAQAPIRSNDQILPFAAWFWNTLTYDTKTKAYSFQLDETQFSLDANLLMEALEITPIDQAHQFVSHPSSDAIMDFVNQLGYTKVIHFVSRMAVNNLYQPRRGILSMITQCLTARRLDMIGPDTQIHNIHQRTASSFYLAEEDFKLGNLKFIPKGEIDEVFGMLILDELISKNIINAPYYNAYLEMAAKHDRKVAADKEGKKKTMNTKQPKSKPAPPKPKPTKKKSTKTTLPQPIDKGKVAKVHKAKSQFQLVDEPDNEPAHSEPEPKLVHQVEGDEDDMELAIRMILESFQDQSQEHSGGVAIREPVAEATRPLLVLEGKDKAIATEEQAAQSLLALHTPKRRSITDQFILQRQTPTTKDALTGPSAQPLDDTSANIVRDSLSLADAEIGARSDKTSSGDEPEKPNVEVKVVSMVTIQIYQESSSVPPMSTPILVIDLSPPKPASSTTQALVFTATTMTTTKLNRIRRMFESGSYKSVPEHIALYEALEASIERAQKDEYLAEKDKSCKTQLEDLPMPGTANISDSEDTNTAHLPKTKQRPEWLKPIPDDEGPANPEPAWVIPSSHIPDAMNNWAKALATTYQAPAENTLLEKTGDMRTFMHWYCQQMGKTELTQANFEGQAYEIVKAFYLDAVHLYKGSGQALLICKMKAARYLDFGLEQLVPEHMWINEVYTYNISSSYGISHWWFNHQKFYIDRHIADPSRKVVRTYMHILSVVSIKAFSCYRVKEYEVNRLNPGMNTLFWTDKDVERSKEFIHEIERRFKTRRIFQNLECFVGGRVHDIGYRLL
nr:hypothetical protein [Tanacetum cinerariifolium]